MDWKPPSEEEFNSEWVLPRQSLKLLIPLHDELSTRQRYVMDRLKSGLILAVARDYEYGTRRERFVQADLRWWKACGDYGEEHFWKVGDETFYGGNLEHRFLDIRFHPHWYKPQHVETLAPTRGEQRVANPPPLSKAEAERFCRAMVTEWGDEVTQDWAYAKATLFFPDKKVTRDPFRLILRSIRGPTKRGKRAKATE